MKIVLDVQKPDLGQLRTTVKVNSIIHLFNGGKIRIYICVTTETRKMKAYVLILGSRYQQQLSSSFPKTNVSSNLLLFLNHMGYMQSCYFLQLSRYEISTSFIHTSGVWQMHMFCFDIEHKQTLLVYDKLLNGWDICIK